MKAPMDELDVVAMLVPVRACMCVCVCAHMCECVCTHGVERERCTTYHTTA